MCNGEDYTPGELIEEIERLARVEGEHVRVKREYEMCGSPLKSSYQTGKGYLVVFLHA